MHHSREYRRHSQIDLLLWCPTAAKKQLVHIITFILT
jgi:hypothetical protein